MDSKPLTSGEIEELKALEAKASPAPWENGQHPAMKSGSIIKPVTFGSHVRVLPECEGGHVALRDEDAALISAMRNVLPRLLSILTPPPDAAVPPAYFIPVEGAPMSDDDIAALAHAALGAYIEDSDERGEGDTIPVAVPKHQARAINKALLLYFRAKEEADAGEEEANRG